MSLDTEYRPPISKYDDFRSVVQKMIDIENAGAGKGHFSQMALDSLGVHTLNLNDLNEDDVISLNLFRDSLNDVMDKISNEPEALNENYRKNLISARAKLSHAGGTPTQRVFRDYLNNKFGGLLGYLQIYTSAIAKGDEDDLNFARKGLSGMRDTYSEIL